MRSLILLLAWFATSTDLWAESTNPQRNILLIITDDQGYGDLGLHGNPTVRTPNLDALGRQSVRLTNFHVSPTCAPTRCALLTGRHEFRSGVTHTIQERERMDLRATTYVDLLKGAGYATGIFGKWHLGDEALYQPDRRSFSEVFIHGAGGIGQSYPGSCGDAPGNMYLNPAIRHNGKFEKTKGYCTDLFFDQAARWIKEQKGPFYAHIATNTPHAPLQCPEGYEAKYAHLNDPPRAKYYGMIENIDDNIGRLMKTLAETGLDQKTIVIFMTDNGGTGGTGGVKEFNAGMRGQKGTPWEGGTRVPCFIRWGEKYPAGERSQLTSHHDLFPTLMSLAGVTVPPAVAAKLEGRNLASLLQGPGGEWANRTLVTHVGRWPQGQVASGKYGHCSIRDERFTLVSTGQGPQQWQLFDLQSDPGQKSDIAATQPAEVQRLEGEYDTWWKSIQPDLVNEAAVPPAENPFKVWYFEQYPEERAVK